MINDGEPWFYSTEPHHRPIFCWRYRPNSPILPFTHPPHPWCMLKNILKWTASQLYKHIICFLTGNNTTAIFSFMHNNIIGYSQSNRQKIFNNLKSTIGFSVLDTVYQNNCYKVLFMSHLLFFFDFSNFSNSTLLDLFQSWLYRQLYKLCFFSWNRVFILHYKTLDWLFHCFYSLIIMHNLFKEK